MFEGFNQQTLDFMWNIRFNNEKSWFEAHKSEYKTVLAQPMTELAHDVAGKIFDKFPKIDLNVHVSRIYRDARRLHGNGPYKDHLWFSLRRLDEFWVDSPVFWFELRPENWSYGLGYYSASSATMEKFRARINCDPKPMEKLARALNRQSEFVIEGTDYARPKGEPGKLLNNWYNKKSFTLIHEDEINEAVFLPDLAERVFNGFSFLMPFYDYFSTLSADPDSHS